MYAMYESHYNFVDGKLAQNGWLVVTHLVGVGVQTQPLILTTLPYTLHKNDVTTQSEVCSPI